MADPEQKRLSDEDRDALQHLLAGTCMSVPDALEQLGLDVTEAVASDQLLAGPVGIEMCGVCEWWHWCHDLTHNESSGHSVCESCAE